MNSPSQRSIVDRMIGAAMLNAATYEEVESDLNATGQAATVVAMYAIAAAIGSWGRGGSGIIGALIGAILGWLSWSSITWFIGTRVFGGTGHCGELLRTLGFAQSPGVLLVLGIIPFFGPLVFPVVGIWLLFAGIIAIRQALDFSMGKAVGTALLGWVVSMMISAVLGGGGSIFAW